MNQYQRKDTQYTDNKLKADAQNGSILAAIDGEFFQPSHIKLCFLVYKKGVVYATKLYS
jgi:hypothetical protein